MYLTPQALPVKVRTILENFDHVDIGLNCDLFPPLRFHYAARIWDGVKKSSALSEYSRLLA